MNSHLFIFASSIALLLSIAGWLNSLASRSLNRMGYRRARKKRRPARLSGRPDSPFTFTSDSSSAV